ncbi:MAG: radical SAM protein [Candidatus Omnitrophica bacterium]|jgi:wyosine [tRNA(Phe)-imidazoG37] synthetase (radical SAM superfamily)|nr:radical SAM protein [Candidatus Omnitrophota bacterium]
MKYIFGPLKSRRLGNSLGITLTPYKICTFDCVYCQLGKTNVLTRERKEYIFSSEIIEELRNWLEGHSAEIDYLQYITLSGSGEPTLNIRIGDLIREIKQICKIPVAVITNGSLLAEDCLRRELVEADLIIPSLDAATQAVFEKIDRPVSGITVDGVIAGLIVFRKEYRGQLWLEIMLAAGINDDLRQIKKLKVAIDKINPDKIQLNSPVRSTTEAGILPVKRQKLEKIRKILGDRCEII